MQWQGSGRWWGATSGAPGARACAGVACRAVGWPAGGRVSTARGRLKPSVAGALAGGHPQQKAAIELREWGMHGSAIPGSTDESLEGGITAVQRAQKYRPDARTKGAPQPTGLPPKKVGQPQRPLTLWSRLWASREQGENRVEAAGEQQHKKKGKG